MRNKSEFIFDIPSLKEVDLRKWHENFFWPVANDEFCRLADELTLALESFFDETIPGDLRDILYIKYKMIYEYQCVLNSAWTINRLVNAGRKILCSEKSFITKGILEKGAPYRHVVLLNPLEPESGKESWLLRVKSIAKKVLYDINHGNMGLGRSIVMRNGTVRVLDPPTDVCLLYLNKLGISSILTHPYDWAKLRDPKKSNREEEEKVRNFSDSVTDKFCDVAKKMKIELSHEVIEYLKEVTYLNLYHTWIDYKAVQGKIRQKGPFDLFTPSGGNYFSRLLSLPLRKSGGRVTGFIHGSDTCRYFDETYKWIELSHVDRFVAHSTANIELFEEVIERYPLVNGNKVQIAGADVKLFKTYYDRRKENKAPRKIKKVMILGLSYLPDFRFKFRYPDMVYLDFEIRLVDFLNRHHFEVIYKECPEGILKNKSDMFFKDKAIIFHEPFEEVMEQTDAMLFPYTTTSTFGPALCTNKPIIYIDDKSENWIPGVFDLIKKRMRVVSGGFDDRNRLIFNEDELLEALKEPPREPDDSFIFKYYF